MAVAMVRRGGRQVALGLTCMLLMVASAAAKEILVGESNGWILTGDANTYQAQMDTAGAQVDDVLVFSHSSSHTVVLLPSQSALLACDASQGQILSPAADAIGTSAYNFTLSGSSGTTFYFICSIPTHCPSGMRFNVTLAAAGAPAPAPEPSGSPPAGSPPTTPAPSPDGTPLASPPSATPTPSTSTPAPAPNGAYVNMRGISAACVVALVAACILG